MPRGRVMTESAALKFAGGTDRVVVAAATSINNLVDRTYIVWFYLTTFTSTNAFGGKYSNAANANRWVLDGTSDLRMTRTQSAGLLNTSTNNAGIVTGKWYCVAYVENGTTGLGSIFRGTHHSPLSECAYSAQTTGTLPWVADDTKPLLIGNRNDVAPGSPIPGYIAIAALFNRVLSLPEIQAWQFSALDAPYPAVMAGCVGLWYPGKNGATKVIDYSGYNNTGTITGATRSRGVSIPALPVSNRISPQKPRLLVQLMQGGRIVAERLASPDSLTTEEWTLTTQERATITDWSDLNLQFEPLAGQAKITQAYLDLPLAAYYRRFGLIPPRLGVAVNTIRDSKNG